MSAEYITIPLSKEHDRKTFSCGEKMLDDYLALYAGQDQKRKEAAIFVYPKDKNIAGYYTLSSLHVDSKYLPKEMLKSLRLSSYPHKPATLLGRLAVGTHYQDKGIGKMLLVDALKRSYYQSIQIGSIAVIVEALNDNASQFYQKYGFQTFPDQPKKLILPMKTISDLF